MCKGYQCVNTCLPVMSHLLPLQCLSPCCLSLAHHFALTMKTNETAPSSDVHW